MNNTTTSVPEQQPRIAPTEPGWWWGKPKTMDEEAAAVAIRVTQSEYSGDLLAAGLGFVGVRLEDVNWIAPIPSPAELAHLRAVTDAARGVVGEEDPWMWIGGVAVCGECHGKSSSELVADIHHAGECFMGRLDAAVMGLLAYREAGSPAVDAAAVDALMGGEA